MKDYGSVGVAMGGFKQESFVAVWLRSAAVVTLLCGLAFFLRPAPAAACVGARPLGMGGAFIAVADDANVTYWNTAALALMGTRQVTGAYVSGTDVNYKYFGSYSQTLSDRFTLGSLDRLSFGASVYTWNKRPIAQLQDGTIVEWEYTRPWVSFAARLPGVAQGELAVGANVNFGRGHLLINNNKESIDIDPGITLSTIYRVNEMLSFGLLAQDLNEMDMKYQGVKFQNWSRNIRPGVAFRPNERITLAADIYHVFDLAHLMFGGEYWINEEIGVRAGMYGMGGAEWVTLGGSYRVKPALNLEAAVMNFEHFILSASFMF